METVRKDVKMHGESRFTAILFDENLKPLIVNRNSGTAGDLIYICIVKNPKETGHYFTVDFHPCSPEPAAPSIFLKQESAYNSETNNSDLEEDIIEKEDVSLEQFAPGICFNKIVTITVRKIEKQADGKDNIKNTGLFHLKQFKRYRATFQMGVLFSKLNDEAFGLRTTEDSLQKIYSKGVVNRDLQYYISLVVYSLPRYLKNLFSSKHRYLGRDIIHDNGFWDRIGLVVGTGINKPFSRFAMGLSFELIHGVNVVGMWEHAKLNQLSEVQVGDIYTGYDIPTQDSWKSKFVIGFSLDLNYISKLGIF